MKNGATWARLAYVGVIALATLAEPALSATGAGDRLGQALATGVGGVTGRDVIDGLRNIVLFAGWGAVWAITSPAARAWPIVFRATASGLLVSAAAEAFQLLSPTRTPSLLDIVTNTGGAFAGALAAAVVIVFLRAGRGRRSFVGMPMVLFAIGYGGAAALEAFSPLFRQDRFPDVWGSVSDRLGIVLQNIEPLGAGVPYFEFLLFVPAGIFGVAALSEFGASYRNGAIVTALLGIAISVGAEVGHGAAGFPIYSGAIAVHATGFAAGSVLAAWLLPSFTRHARGAVRPFALWWSYAFVLALWYLRPFSPELDAASIAAKLPVERFIPLQAYRERVDVFSAADAVGPVLMLVPLGALLAVWPMRHNGPLRAILPGVYLMLALESAQILVAGRFFDVTDAIIAVAALGLGWAMARRAGYRPYGEMLPVTQPGATARRATS